MALACLAGEAFAIDPGRSMSQYVREQWGPDQGFPPGPVYAISQTPDGYLWIGTEKGLVRFDGVNFRLLRYSSTQIPTLTRVLGLAPDKEGNLWVRLRRPTLLRYRNGEFENPTSLPPRLTVANMTPALDGSLLVWILEKEPRAALLKGGKLETIAAPVNFSRAPVLAMTQTGDGDLWLGTRDSGLYRIRKGVAQPILDGLPDRKVNALFAVGKSELWIGTDSGIVYWDGSQLTSEGVPKELRGVQALALTQDHDGNLWVGTDSHGLLRFNPNAGEVLDGWSANTAPQPAVTAVFEDREGNLWAGSDSKLERIRDSPFISYSRPEGLQTEGGVPVFVDEDGRTWFAPVSGGLCWFKEGRQGQIKSDGLDRDVVYSISGRGREVWAARQHGGLTRIVMDGDRAQTKTYTTADGLAQNSVYAVAAARDGSVWAGTLSGGVSRLASGRFQNYTTDNGLASDSVSAILEDSKGAVWIATPVGLSVFSNGQWRNIGSKQGLPEGEVHCMLEDSRGGLWFGTSAGLILKDKEKFRFADRLLSVLRERVLGLAEDRNGALWIATASRILRGNLDQLRSGSQVKESLREFSNADGLRGTEGVRRFQSVIADSRGRIWLSVNQGISVVTPSRLARSQEPAIAQIQNVSADGNAFGIYGPLQIPGGSHRVNFSYAGLSLAVPGRVRYQYQLDNYDRGWSEPVSSRETGYTNLPPGYYRFRVRASNPDGLWNGPEASVAFEIQPLLWQAWWFQLAVALAALAMVAILYRVRLLQITHQLNVRFEERFAERTRIAQELHDTLLQGFLSASMQVHVAAERLTDDAPVKPALTHALTLMRQVIEEGRNAVRGLRISQSNSLDLEQAFSKIRGELVPMGYVGKAPKFEVKVTGSPRPLHPLLRDEVYRIGREALTNAFRHARAELLELELHYSLRELKMTVRDDGCGMDAETLASGREGHWGLSGMRERAARIGARLQIRSRPGAGTEVILRVSSHIAFRDHQLFGWTRLSRWRLNAILRNTGDQRELTNE